MYTQHLYFIIIGVRQYSRLQDNISSKHCEIHRMTNITK